MFFKPVADELSYENLKKELFNSDKTLEFNSPESKSRYVAECQYDSKGHAKNFIEVRKVIDQKKAFGTSKEKGYKIHISLDESEKNLSSGWNIVSKILMKNGVTHFKVVKNGFDNDHSDQRGKEITIYSSKDPTIDWKKVIEEINDELLVNNITPGVKPRTDASIAGTAFFFYRDDSDGKAKDVAGFEKMKIQVSPDVLANEIKQKLEIHCQELEKELEKKYFFFNDSKKNHLKDKLMIQKVLLSIFEKSTPGKERIQEAKNKIDDLTAKKQIVFNKSDTFSSGRKILNLIENYSKDISQGMKLK